MHGSEAEFPEADRWVNRFQRDATFEPPIFPRSQGTERTIARLPLHGLPPGADGKPRDGEAAKPPWNVLAPHRLLRGGGPPRRAAFSSCSGGVGCHAQTSTTAVQVDSTLLRIGVLYPGKMTHGTIRPSL